MNSHVAKTLPPATSSSQDQECASHVAVELGLKAVLGWT